MSEIIKTENGLTYAKWRNLLSNASGSVTLSLPDTVKGVAVVLRKQGDDEAITLNDIGENLGGVLI